MFIVTNTSLLPSNNAFAYAPTAGRRRMRAMTSILPTSAQSTGGGRLRKGCGAGGEALPRPADESHLARKKEKVDQSIAMFEDIAVDSKAWISRVMNRVTTGFVKDEVWEYIGDQCFECGAAPSCALVLVFQHRRRQQHGLRRLCGPVAHLGLVLVRGIFAHGGRPQSPQTRRGPPQQTLLLQAVILADEEISAAGCVGCGRCAWVCPGESACERRDLCQKEITR